MTKLNKEDWEKIDELLGKIGFGGYYDFIELLKMSIINIKPVVADMIHNETDLQQLMVILYNSTKGVKDK
ncbi:MAG: hypothetical protein WC365_06750 [Candidatus Babeliales bacterium]|jgi:hypothetical protein